MADPCVGTHSAGVTVADGDGQIPGYRSSSNGAWRATWSLRRDGGTLRLRTADGAPRRVAQ
jgi:hypothetical protein